MNLHHPSEMPTESERVAELHAERRMLCSLIEEQRRELARTEHQLHDANRQIAHLRRLLDAQRGRWWRWPTRNR